MKSSFAALLALSLTFCFFASSAQSGNSAADEDSGKVLGMVTGSRTGTYIAFGRDIAKEAAKDGVTVNVYDSKGSIDNIRRITSKEKVGLAIVQSDVLSFLNHSKNKESMEMAKKLRLVAPFYDEEVHVLANRSINSLEDLNGKRVVVGSENSGSVITAANIFSILGITPGKMYEIDPPHGAVAVLNGEVDAMVFVGGKPVKMFKNMEELEKGPNAGKLAQVHFVPINDQRLLKEYKSATLMHGDYSYVNEPVPTIAVTALLITYDYTMRKGAYYSERCQNMGKLVKSLYSNIADLKANGHPKWQEVDLNANVGDWKRDPCSSKTFASTATVKTPVASNDNNTSTLEKDLLGVVKGQ